MMTYIVAALYELLTEQLLNRYKTYCTQKTHTGTYNAHWLVVHNNEHWYSTHNSVQ